MANVLVLAPHADDETLGVGGTIAKHLDEGDDVSVVIATGPGKAPDGHPLWPREEFDTVRAEASRSLKGLGVSTVTFGDLPAVTFPHAPAWQSTLQGRDLWGPVVAHVATAQWAQEHGFTVGHLGGGSGESLLEFKGRFDPTSQPRDFHIMQLVHDAENYRSLTQGLPETPYFPAWRDPLISEGNKNLQKA